MLSKLFVVIVISFVLAGCGHVAKQEGDKNSGFSEDDLEERIKAQVEGRFIKGESAPELVVKSFFGEKIRFSSFYGKKAMVLDFWAGGRLSY